MFTWKLAKQWRQLVGVPETDPSEPESGSPTWVELEFSTEGPEGSLRLAWISYCDIFTQDDALPEAAPQALAVFVVRFVATFESWQPTEVVQAPDAVAESLDGPGSRGAAIGCAGGHPTAVIATFIDHLRSRVTKWDEVNAADAAGQGGEAKDNLELIHALMIATRSFHNRKIFGHYGGLETIMRYLRGLVEQLKALCGGLSASEGRPPPLASFTEISFVQCLLAHVVSILANHVEAEARATRLLGASALEGGGVVALVFLHMEGLSTLIDLVGILRDVGSSGASTGSSLELLILRTLRSALGAHPKLRQYLPGTHAFPTLLRGLGPPLSEPADAEEFERQITTLRLLRDAVVSEVGNAEELISLGGCHRFTSLLRWASLHFSPPSDRSEGELQLWNPQSAEVCRVLCSFATVGGIEVVGRTFTGLGGEEGGGKYWDLVTNSLIWVFVEVFCDLPDGSDLDALFQQRSAALQSHVLAVFRHLLPTSPSALLYFRERWAWKVLFGPCFFYFQLPQRAVDPGLELSVKVMADLEALSCTPRGMRGKPGKAGLGHLRSPSTSVTARDGGIYGRPSRASSSYGSLENAALSRTSSLGLAGPPSRNSSMGHSSSRAMVAVGEEVKDLPSSPPAQSLRQEVLALLQAAAGGEEVQSNSTEVSALLGALVRCAVAPRTAHTLADCLHSILQLAPSPTVAALEELEGGLLLAHVISRQQAVQREGEGEGEGDGEGEGEQRWASRLALFRLMAEYLNNSEAARRAAATDWDTTNTLFSLLQEEGARSFALPAILQLMKAPPRSTWSSMGLFTDYAKTLSYARAGGDLPLILDLLRGVRCVVEGDPEVYQRLFLEGECCACVVGLLEDPYPRHLCLEVLATLTTLVAGSTANKRSFDYATLGRLLLDRQEQVPGREVVMGVAAMMVERAFDPEGDMVIRNDCAIALFFTLLQRCEDPLRTEGLEVFEQLLVASVANRAACVRASLLQLLLQWLACERHLPTQLRVGRLVERVGSYSLSGKDLRALFSLLRSLDSGCRPRHASLLLRTLRAMVKDDGPAVFFHFSGHDSGMRLTAPLRFPSRGFSFTCWLRCEGFPPPPSPPMGLFRLATEGGRGYTAHLQRHQVSVAVRGAKEQTVAFRYSLPLHRWTFLAVTHSVGQMLTGPGSLKLYADEHLVEAVKLPYPPVAAKDPLTDCSIACGHPPHALPFRGQLGPIYLFKEGLTEGQVDAVFSLGPGYMYSFSPREFGQVGETFLGASQRLPEEAEGLGSKILASYNAAASAGPLLLDTSPQPEQGADALVLGGVQLCLRQRVQDVIHTVGGIGVLFPLFTQLDQPLEGREEGETAAAGDPHLVLDVVGLLTAVLAGNHASQLYMLNMSGFAALGFLLRRMHPRHLSLKFVLALENLVGTVAHPQDASLADALVTEAVTRLFLDPLVWIHSPYAVQHELYGSLFRQVDKDTERFRHLCGFTQLLDIVRSHYPTPGSAKPTPPEVGKLRLGVLAIAERMLRGGFLVGEVKALVAYVETCKDGAACSDVVGMVLGLLGRKVRLASLVQITFALGGCSIFFSLLHKPQEELRLMGLRLLGSILVATPHDKRVGKEPPSGSPLPPHQRSMVERTALAPLFKAMEEAVAAHPWTPALRNTLLDVLMGVPSVRRNLSDGTFLLPQMLPILLRHLAPCAQEERLEVVGALGDLLERQESNRQVVAQEPAWQEGLLHLLSLQGEEEAAVYRCFRLVHAHAILRMKAGWRPLERTLDFVHLVAEQGALPQHRVLRCLLADVIHQVLEESQGGGLVLQQPCKDNCLYLLTLVDEVAIKDCAAFLQEEEGEAHPKTLSNPSSPRENGARGQPRSPSLPSSPHQLDCTQRPQPRPEEDMWRLYNHVWLLLCALNGVAADGRRGVASPADDLPLPPPTFGQRARAVVESLNGPAIEMMGGSGRHSDKALKMRGEKCPRIVFRLLLLYLYEAEVESARRFCTLYLALLPALVAADSEALRNRVHNLLAALEIARSNLPPERVPLVDYLISGTIEGAGTLLATSLGSRGGGGEGGVGAMLQEERISSARKEAYRHLLASHAKRVQEVHNLQAEVAEGRRTEGMQGCALREKRSLLMLQLCQEDGVRRAAARLLYEAEQQATARHWMQMYRDLTAERGSWSSTLSVPRWKLDKTEDPQRRRMRLRPNYRFDPTLLSPPTDDRQGGAREGGEDPNEHVRTLLLKGWRGSLAGRDGGGDGEVAEEGEGGEVCAPPMDRTISIVDDEVITSLQKSPSVSERSVWGERDGEEGEKVVAFSDCILVTAKRKLAGRLEVMGKSLMFHSQFVVEGNGGCSLFDEEGKLRSPPGGGGGGGGGVGTATSPRPSTRVVAVECAVRKDTDLQQDVKQHRRWRGALLKEIRIARFLLHTSALELFFSAAVPPVFFNLPSPQAAKDVAAALVAMGRRAAPERGRRGEVVVVDRKKALEAAERAKAAWCRRDLSSFDYLMQINTLAGRSHNDLMQYPVFPWVVADYTSPHLRLQDPATFRDLSKPMGALDDKRFEAFLERYSSFTDPDIPSFFYGSHYSTAGIVLFYLLRLEPFSTLNRTLQGGKFDHADRLFYSMASTYANCLRNSSDVKELIPEFYYHSAFLSNDNEYHLGVKQDGLQLGDVILPPWANHSPDLFVRRCREALECEHVSERLHQWVDLIFGYKQRGQAAVEAANLFYHLTYEGAVDLQAIQDPFARRAMEDQIAEFGQTPVQLFRKPHPARAPPPATLSRPLVWAPDAFALTSRVAPPADPSAAAALRSGAEAAAVLFIGVADGKAVVLTRAQLMTVRTASSAHFSFAGGTEVGFSFGDNVFGRQIGTPFSGGFRVSSQCFGMLAGREHAYLLTGGHWDNSFQCVSVADGKTVRSICQHNDVVTCLSVSSDGTRVVTGSRDTAVMVWAVEAMEMSEGRGLVYGERFRMERMVSDKPRAVLCGHDDTVTCVAVKTELDLVVSGSTDGTFIAHTLNQGRYLWSKAHPTKGPLEHLAVSREGLIVVYSPQDVTLHVCTVNGKWLASVEEPEAINALALSSDEEFVMTGGNSGVVRVRWFHSLELQIVLDKNDIPITAITATEEDCIVVGLEDGQLLVYSVDAGAFAKKRASNP